MMRLRCFGCTKVISTLVPDATVVRGILYCPECFLEETTRLRALIGDRVDELRIGVGTEPIREPHRDE